MTEPGASFAFLGFNFRWMRGAKTGEWYACIAPRPKKVTGILREVRDVLRRSRHLQMRAAVRDVNLVIRGWVNYFRVGNSSQAFDKVKYHAERKVRRFAAKKCKRQGHAWKRWSSDVVCGAWGLFDDYRLAYQDRAKVSLHPRGIITPM